VNDKIIYVAISGFGAIGTNPERAAFDIIVQATSGQFWKDLDNLMPPTNHWADFMSGAYAALAALLALIHRMNTGEGQYIDLSMQDVLYYNNYRALVNKAMEPILADVEKALDRKPEDVLNSSDRMPFYGFFKAKDGKVAIVAITPRQWQDLAEVMERPDLVGDPRFADLIVQVHNHKEAVAIIDEWTSQRSSAEIIALLEAKKIPCGMAYTLDEVNQDENLRRRGMFQCVHHPTLGDIDVPGVPFGFSKTPGSIRMPAPGLGEHNRFVLENWLSLSHEEISALEAEGVVVSSS